MKQIRVQIPTESYNELKLQSKKFRMTLGAYCGLKLGGFDIVKTGTTA